MKKRPLTRRSRPAPSTAEPRIAYASAVLVDDAQPGEEDSLELRSLVDLEDLFWAAPEAGRIAVVLRVAGPEDKQAVVQQLLQDVQAFAAERLNELKSQAGPSASVQ